MLHIVGTITATTHIHQTDPNKEGNLSRTIKTYGWGPDHVRRLIPIVTGNSGRGLLRRHGATLALDAIAAPVPRGTFSAVTNGKITRKDIGMQASARIMVEGGNNIFAGLFGGGGYMLPSRYSLGPLIPMVEWCREWLHPSLRDKVIPKERLSYTIQTGPDAGKVVDVPLVTELILTSRDDILAGKGLPYIQGGQTSIDAWIAEVTSGRVAKAVDKAEKEAAKKRGEKPTKGPAKAISVDISGYNLIEAMLPGTPLQFWLRFLPKATDAQIGFMLMAVREWANANVLGGASARGFGRFNADLWVHDDSGSEPVNLFNLGDPATAYTLNEGLGRYITAATEALKVLTPEDLDLAYGVSVIAAAGADDV